MENNNINTTYTQRQTAKRNRRALWLHTVNGIKQAFTHPCKVTIFIMYLLIMLFIHANRYHFLTQDNIYAKGVIDLAFYVIGSFFMWGVIVWLGTPWKATSIEDDVMAALTDTTSESIITWKTPIIISKKLGKLGVVVYKFDSKYFTLEEWQSTKKLIEKALEVEILGGIKEEGDIIFFNARHHYKKPPKVDDKDPLFL